MGVTTTYIQAVDEKEARAKLYKHFCNRLMVPLVAETVIVESTEDICFLL